MIRFGAWSITLLIGSLHGLAMAALLLRTRANRAANRWLAGLLMIVVLMITPYTIGYAGFYDAWPWLTFAPFFWQLGIGPLIYLYVRQLGSGPAVPGWPWHFVPLALQVGYYATLFCLPLEAKWHWNDTVHRPWVAPALQALTLASIGLYLAAAARRYRFYQRWLAGHSAAREEFHLAWLRGFLAATGATTLVAAGFGAVHWFARPLSYFDEFPLYLVFSLLVYYLGVEGWRHAAVRFPQIDAVPDPPCQGGTSPAAAGAPPGGAEPVDAEPGEAPTRAAPRDWAALGARVRQQVAAEGWWREPDLELGELARRVGTNTNYLSRALNEGLAMNFSEFINRQRIEAAQARLLEPGEVLDIAFDVGFRSKASFNSAFKTYTGRSPTEWRAAAEGRAGDG